MNDSALRYWGEIAPSITKPWPAAAMLVDLDWFDSEFSIGVGARRTAPSLAARWGVSLATAMAMINRKPYTVVLE